MVLKTMFQSQKRPSQDHVPTKANLSCLKTMILDRILWSYTCSKACLGRLKTMFLLRLSQGYDSETGFLLSRGPWFKVDLGHL
jgi:hypothetical protein